MGFCYFGYGHTHPCKISGGKVSYLLPSGMWVSANTALQEEVREQTIPFLSDTVAFYLEDNDKSYVGRYDGSISMYRLSDDLLVGLNYWEAPKYPNTVLIGYFNNDYTLGEVHLDLNDHRTAYVSGAFMQGCFPEPVYGDIDLFASESMAAARYKQRDTYIMKGDDSLVAENFWSVQKNLRVRDCRVFL